MEYILIPSIYQFKNLKNYFMKKISLASIIAGALILSACNGNSSKTSTTDSTATNTMNTGDTTNNTNKMSSTDTMNHMNMNDTMNHTNSTATVGSDEKDFAKDAAAGGMMEVQLGNIAQKNSSTKAVQDFGKMMVDDHSKANDNLKDLASKKNVTLPTTVTDKQQKDIDKLSKETGTAFDKDYVNMMVDDHKKDIAEFKKAGEKMKDPDFKDFVVKTLPTLQKHLDAIQSIKKKM
jgi:putative membrane protein